MYLSLHDWTSLNIICELSTVVRTPTTFALRHGFYFVVSFSPLVVFVILYYNHRMFCSLLSYEEQQQQYTAIFACAPVWTAKGGVYSNSSWCRPSCSAIDLFYNRVGLNITKRRGLAKKEGEREKERKRVTSNRQEQTLLVHIRIMGKRKKKKKERI